MALLRRLRGSVKVVVIVAVVVGLGYLSLYLRWPVERPLAYWLVSDTRLGIVVGDAGYLSCDVANVDESPDAVVIHARCWERVVPVPQPAILQAYPMEVTLRAPLGSRTVKDGSGNLGTLCSNPFPDCMPG